VDGVVVARAVVVDATAVVEVVEGINSSWMASTKRGTTVSTAWLIFSTVEGIEI
jgi:hypothetical protein